MDSVRHPRWKDVTSRPTHAGIASSSLNFNSAPRHMNETNADKYDTQVALQPASANNNDAGPNAVPTVTRKLRKRNLAAVRGGHAKGWVVVGEEGEFFTDATSEELKFPSPNSAQQTFAVSGTAITIPQAQPNVNIVTDTYSGPGLVHVEGDTSAPPVAATPSGIRRLFRRSSSKAPNRSVSEGGDAGIVGATARGGEDTETVQGKRGVQPRRMKKGRY